jgi:hypothetical protein
MPPQNPGDMPQKPKLLQQTLRGQTELLDHLMPQPGSHSLFQLHWEMQLSPQKSGPPPHTPFPVFSSLQACQKPGRRDAGTVKTDKKCTYKAPQHPIGHPFVFVQVYACSSG